MHYIVRPFKGNEDDIGKHLRKLIDYRMCVVEMAPDPELISAIKSDKAPSHRTNGKNGGPTAEEQIWKKLNEKKPEQVTSTDITNICRSLGLPPHNSRHPIDKWLRSSRLKVIKKLDHKVRLFKVTYDG
jgi:hypothetical protein